MILYGYDKEFLEQLMLHNNKKVFVKISVLAFNEEPIQDIEGIATGGSINVDGESSVRRTCSLSMIVKNDIKIKLGLNSKFKFSVGLQNNINPNYPDIIWFKQGTYIATNYSLSEDITKTTLTLTGKDKGCLLNGEVSGQFFADIKLDTIEVMDNNNNIQYKKLLIKDIIYSLLTEMAHESPSNILLNDLDEYGYELLEYRGKDPLYIIYTWDKEWIPVYCTQDEPGDTVKNNYKITDFSKGPFDPDDPWGYTELNTGELAGYHQTQLIYPSDLIMKAGETVAAALDKIKAMFPTYEYFYNLEGQFVFQRKAMYIEEAKHIKKLSYAIFNNLKYENIISNEKLITAVSPNTKLNELKNDFSVWGTRENANGANIPIHARIAIDKKPTAYKRITVKENDIDTLRNLYPDQYPEDSDFYIWNDDELPREFTDKDYDWREIIYQMAMDYQRYHLLDDFYYRVKQANPQFIDGKTGYEQYYTDILGFWRQIYDLKRTYKFARLAKKDGKSTTWKGSYIDILAEENADILKWCQLYDDFDTESSHNLISNGQDQIEYSIPWTVKNIKKYNLQYQPCRDPAWLVQRVLTLKTQGKDISIEEVGNYFTLYESIPQYEEDYWHTDVNNNPTSLNFWFDFVEPRGEMEKFSVQAIGQRSKSVNDKDANVIILPDAPEIQYKLTTEVQKPQGNLSLKSFQLPNYLYNLFTVASKQTAAIDKCSELLNQHTQTMGSLTLTTLPIYYLEPNCMFDFIFNTMEGKYIITKFSVPLTYNGTMSITANKILVDQMEVGV